MAYYYSHPYRFSTHGLDRCRQRLRLIGKDDFFVRQKVIELINSSNHQFETRDSLYIRAGQTGALYFIISKADRLVITCTPISIEKQMSLCLDEEW